MDGIAQPLPDFIKAHSEWAALVMFVTAFGESFPLVGLVFPGTTVLMAAGTLLSAGTLPYVPILLEQRSARSLEIRFPIGLGVSLAAASRECGHLLGSPTYSRQAFCFSSGMAARVSLSAVSLA